MHKPIVMKRRTLMKLKDFINRSIDYDDSIYMLWESKSEAEWNKALDHYWTRVANYKTYNIEREFYTLDHKEIEIMNEEEFFLFLKEKYFPWKFGETRWCKTSIKNLEKNNTKDLLDIKNRIISADKDDIKKCLKTAMEVKGLGVAGAAGLLSILFPQKFGTVDQFLVASLLRTREFCNSEKMQEMDSRRQSLKVDDGVYLEKILRKKSKELNDTFRTSEWTPRKIDMVLWCIGR